jgi:hypothetical protein
LINRELTRNGQHCPIPASCYPPENLSVRRIAFSKLLVLLAGAPLLAAFL